MTHEHSQKQGYTSSNTQPCISPVIGDGDDAHRLVRVGSWSLTAWCTDDEPRIQDIDLAERLGFEQPRDVRKLIKRLEKENEISDVYVRATVARTQMPTGGTRETVVNEAWLTETQALMVAVHSRTEKAKALRKEMIEVYVAARRGLLPQQRGLTEGEVVSLVVRTMAERDAAFMARLPALIIQGVDAVLAKRADADVGGIGPSRAERHVLRPLREIARLRVGNDDDKKALRSMRQQLDHELRGFVDLAGNRSWRYITSAQLARVEPQLASMRRHAEEIDAARRGAFQRAQQLSVFELVAETRPRDKN